VLFNSIFCYLTAHPHIPHSVAELANMFNMHGARLAHGFRQHFNMGIIPFIKMNRMMLIYNRLMQKSFTLSMLAEATGYRNVLEMVNEVEEYYDCDVRALRRGM
jgi:transcriptional regulator GlxA family with amidase domain